MLVTGGGMRAAHLRGERKLVTVLFVDVANSTALTDQIGPEEWTAVMNRAYEAMTPIVSRYDGTVARLMGDALLAFFGAPAGHEDDPSRAVHAGLDILSAARALAAETQRTYGIEFAVRIGITTGSVVLGDVGTDAKYEYTAMGQAVNLGARLQAAARPMSVLISAETYARVASEFECVDSGTLKVKGVLRPLRVYEVQARKPHASGVTLPPLAARGSLRELRSPFVGRDAELRVLRERLQRLHDGEGSIVALIGDAGLGKTRLLTECRRLVADESVTWLEGQPLSLGRAVSYWSFREVLRDAAAITPDCSDAEAFERLEQLVARLFARPSEILPHLGSVVGLEMRGEWLEPLRYLDAEATRRQTFRAMWRFVDALARERPLVLAFDDVHWMDGSSAELLEHLAPLIETVPLLICVLTRPERDGALSRLSACVAADRFVEIGLGPLAATALRQLVESMPGADSVPAHVRDQIVQVGSGNPFYTEELYRTVKSRTASVDTDAARLIRVDVPDTVHALISARIDRLHERTREVLKMAAVIGITFQKGILEASLDDGDLDGPLAELERHMLIRALESADEQAYSFEHALTQETAYASILDRQRRELHERVAMAIERSFSANLEDVYGALAYHYTRAEQLDRAREYLLAAGDQAGQVAADAEALTHYRRALAAWEQVEGDGADPMVRASLDRKIGEALFRRGDHAQARVHLERALQELGSPLPTTPWHTRLTLLRETARQVVKAFLPGPSDRPDDLPVDPAAEESVLVYRPLCWIDVWSNRERFLLEVLLVLRRCQLSGHRLGEIQALSGLAMTFDLAGVVWLAKRFGDRAVELAERLAHPIGLGTAHGSLGHHWHTVGRLADAVSAYARSASEFQRAGDIRGWGAAMDGLTLALCLQGRLEAAAERSGQTLRVGTEAGDPQVVGWGQHSLGEAQLNLGLLEESAHTLGEARERLMSVQDYLGVVHTVGLLAQCYYRIGDFERARLTFASGEALVTKFDLKGGNITALRVGQAEMALAELQSAAHDRETLERTARRACESIVRHAQVYRLGLPAAHRWMGTYAWLTNQLARARSEWRRSEELASRVGARLELGMTLLESGRWQKDTAQINRAAELFAESRASYHLALARDALTHLT